MSDIVDPAAPFLNPSAIADDPDLKKLQKLQEEFQREEWVPRRRSTRKTKSVQPVNIAEAECALRSTQKPKKPRKKKKLPDRVDINRIGTPEKPREREKPKEKKIVKKRKEFVEDGADAQKKYKAIQYTIPNKSKRRVSSVSSSTSSSSVPAIAPQSSSNPSAIPVVQTLLTSQQPNQNIGTQPQLVLTTAESGVTKVPVDPPPTPVPPAVEPVKLSKTSSAMPIRILDDCMTAVGEKGYRMVRCSHGVSEGDWFFEITVLDPDSKYPKDKSHTRLGWCTEEGDLDCPVGYDRFSYSYRDTDGTKFHQSLGIPYGDGYEIGDVIGFYISLPSLSEEVRNQRKLQTSEQRAVQTIPGSEIIFYKNGISQGIAFSDILEGTYRPAASLYYGAAVRFNFGPDFKYEPTHKPKWLWRPMMHMQHGKDFLPPLVAPPKRGSKRRRKFT